MDASVLACYKCKHSPVDWDFTESSDPQGLCSKCQSHQPYAQAVKARALIKSGKPMAPQRDSGTVAVIASHQGNLVQAATVTWLEMLRRDLDMTLAKIAAVDQLKGEAERMANALIAYGERDVPPMPWRRAPAPVVAAYYPRTCRACGKTKSHKNGRKDGTEWVCYRCAAKESP